MHKKEVKNFALWPSPGGGPGRSAGGKGCPDHAAAAKNKNAIEENERKQEHKGEYERLQNVN